jgi:serine/threonine-protein kinase RsbW
LDTIAVRVPASPQYLQVIRLIAASLASRLGFTIDDIEDLKIAVDELTAYLTGRSGRDGMLEISFHVHDDRIEITGTGRFVSAAEVRTELSDFSRQILGTVADSASLQQSDGTPHFRLVKSKRS